MKKIAILGAVLALSTSALADSNSNFYAKAGAFGTIGNKLFDDSKAPWGKDNNKYGEFTFGGTLAAGYKVMDNVRTELQVHYFFGPKWKISTKSEALTNAEAKLDADKKVLQDVESASPRSEKDITNAQLAVDTDKAKVNSLASEKIEGHIKASGPAVFLNAYVDVVDMGPAKLYVGGGLGMSYIKLEGEAKKDNSNSKKEKDTTTMYEAKAKFAWNVGAGLAFEVSEGIAIDVGYSFVDLGKPGDKKSDDKKDTAAEWKGNRITCHNITVGARFAL